MTQKRKTRTAILTPMQVREAVVAWALEQNMFPAHWTAERLDEGLVTLQEDGSATVKVFSCEETKVQP